MVGAHAALDFFPITATAPQHDRTHDNDREYRQGGRQSTYTRGVILGAPAIGDALHPVTA